MIRTAFAAALLLCAASPAIAATLKVEPGEGAQEKLQEALILAKPGDTVELGAGRFVLTDGLSLDVPGVTVKGAGMEATVLDFTRQQGAGEGLLVTSDDVTLRDFAVENAKGDAIKSKGADRIVYYRVRAEWTGGPKETNGAYGIYPVESDGVLIDGVVARGASDAGIYVGQSRNITVRHSVADGNVAGIEIENSRNALVTGNYLTRNTGGILVFDLPNLPVMGGGDVVVTDNLVVGNDTPNFAPKGNIVASVRRGTGIMIMANDQVIVEGNTLAGNPTSDIMVIAYPLKYEDDRYNPYPRRVTIGFNNVNGSSGRHPQLPGAQALLAAFGGPLGGALPTVMWDGIAAPDAPTLAVHPGLTGWSMNLPGLGASPEQAKPGPLKAPKPGQAAEDARVGAPAELEKRIG
jgi:parallel beta-helix repeat protein